MTRLRTLVVLTCLALTAGTSGSALAEERTSFKIAWSIYVGWMPWAYADEMGIVDKWAQKYGIEIEVTQINDYIESINQYTAGGYDGCVMTNMDALTIPAAGGVDSTALILGDFSNGNDGIVSKNGIDIWGLKGETINLVELSVSHYLLARALDDAGLTERDVTLINTSDADMVAAFTGSDEVTTVVTWNPLLSEIEAQPGASKIFDSSQIPGEIIDMMVVNTEVLEANPNFGKALVGAWYETMGLMLGDSTTAIEARTYMAEQSGTDLAGYDSQLATTKMFFDAAEAVEFAKSPALKATMDHVRNFSHTHGLLGDGAASVDAIGMTFPGDEMLGDSGNVKLRFNVDYMEMAARGAL
ncbi:MAG: putative urea ABC transporter substrate-binding protein [Pseudomonadota bacterium]